MSQTDGNKCKNKSPFCNPMSCGIVTKENCDKVIECRWATLPKWMSEIQTMCYHLVAYGDSTVQKMRSTAFYDKPITHRKSILKYAFAEGLIEGIPDDEYHIKVIPTKKAIEWVFSDKTTGDVLIRHGGTFQWMNEAEVEKRQEKLKHSKWKRYDYPYIKIPKYTNKEAE